MYDLAFYGLPVLAVVGTLLVFRRDRALFARRLRELAAEVGGRVEAGRWPYHARWTLDLGGGAELEVSGLYGSSEGSAARTYAWMRSVDLGGLTLEVARRPGREGLLERLGPGPARTGHGEFDRAFSWQGTRDFDVLDRATREALLALDERRAVRLRAGVAPSYRRDGRGLGPEEERLEVTMRGVPPRAEDLARLVAAARAAHGCLRSAPAPSRAA